MRTLDRYLARQLFPVWLWCLLVFLFVSCLIDLFGRLDEILHYKIPMSTVGMFYLNFIPTLFVQVSPLALLLASAFIAMRMVRYQELLAMNAGGISRERAVIPFLFVGWLVSLAVFMVNDAVVPRTSAAYERLRYDVFRAESQPGMRDNVAVMDTSNRLYHARTYDERQQSLADLTILEHDAQNNPKRSLYARQAVFTPHGLLLLYGTVSQLAPSGALIGDPVPFVERLLVLPISPQSFREPDGRPETLRVHQLRRLIRQLKRIGITNLRRYRVELEAKVTFPLMNLVMCLIAFAGSTKRQGRGQLLGLGRSLGWGVLYYLGVAVGQGIGKEGFLPVMVAVWLPHVIAVAICVWLLRKQS